MCRIETANDDSFPEGDISFDESFDWDPEFFDIHDFTSWPIGQFESRVYRRKSEVGVAYIKFVHVDIQRRKVCPDVTMKAGVSEKISTVLERFASHHFTDQNVVFQHCGRQIRGGERVQDLMRGKENTLVVKVARK